MKKTFFAVLLAAALLAAGCKQRDISGQVLEHGTEQPIEGATVTLSACSGELLGSTNCYRKATTTTDDEGRFGFGGEGTIVTAEAAGYWPSDDNFGFLNSDEKGYKPATLYLYPHAWLKVTLKNESGAYGFYPPSNSSETPPIQVPIGQTLQLPLRLVRGNLTSNYIFTVREDVNAGFPSQDYWNTVVVMENGYPLTINIGFGASVKFTPVGHDTTSFVITY
jgi:hypothetical protein